MSRKGPLADSYPGAVALVVLALVPYLILSTALQPLSQMIAKDVGLSRQAFALTTGMANAGYAFGTVLAVQLAMHLPQRRLLIGYALLFTFGSVLAATAWVPGLFVAGRVLQGLCTSLMLIAAVPPLVIGWPIPKMRWTAMTMNLCIFGAVAAGPVIGGIQADSGHWRPLLWIVAGLGALAVLFALLTYEDQPAQDRSAPWDWVAQTLAGLGCAAAFFGASELTTHRFMSVIVFLPLCAGATLIALLLAHQYRVKNPLMRIRPLVTTLPVAGIIIAMTAGAASVAVIELTQTVLQTRTTPWHAAMLFWPLLGGALISAVVFGTLFRTRFVSLIALFGMVVLAGGIAVLSGVATGPNALVVVGSGLLGIGVGASVSPALFTAGFSQQSSQLQRIFALIELLRGTAAFIAAPVLLHVAQTIGGGPAGGTRIALWACFLVAAMGGLIAVYLFVIGRFRPRAPDIEDWQEGDGVALRSPAIGAAIRGESALGAPLRPPA